MTLAHDLQIPSKKDVVPPEEWQARVELAAVYRLVAAHGWDDGVATHISARVPGSNNLFLINPLGLYFEEITASSLVKVDPDGQVLDDVPFEINAPGFTIHSAVHAAREDAHCVIHLHTNNGAAVSVQEHGLLPLTQHAMIFSADIAYHEYEGVSLDLSERERLVEDLGDRNVMILRNHGTLAVGKTCADAWTRMFGLERACAIQIKALAGGQPIHHVRDQVLAHVQKQATQMDNIGMIGWAGALRWLDRRDSTYRE